MTRGDTSLESVRKKINIRHKWLGILGLWGLEIIIRLFLFDCNLGGELSARHLSFVIAGLSP